MRMALVFGGGGGKGSYQIGVWKALCELGWENYFDCVIGTSVGALNAFLYGQGSYEHAYRVWNEISNRKIMAPNTDLENGLKSQKGLDSLIRANITDKFVRSVYVCCTRVTNVPVILEKYEAEYFKLNDYDRDEKVKILLASTAIPGAFPAVCINGSYYRDGGAIPQNNNPFTKALELGYKNVLTIRLDKGPSYYSNGVYYLCPSASLGDSFFRSTVDFNPQNVAWRMNLGYSDLMSKRKEIEDYIIRKPVSEVPSSIIEELRKRL